MTSTILQDLGGFKKFFQQALVGRCLQMQNLTAIKWLSPGPGPGSVALCTAVPMFTSHSQYTLQCLPYLNTTQIVLS